MGPVLCLWCLVPEWRDPHLPAERCSTHSMLYVVGKLLSIQILGKTRDAKCAQQIATLTPICSVVTDTLNHANAHTHIYIYIHIHIHIFAFQEFLFFASTIHNRISVSSQRREDMKYICLEMNRNFRKRICIDILWNMDYICINTTVLRTYLWRLVLSFDLGANT